MMNLPLKMDPEDQPDGPDNQMKSRLMDKNIIYQGTGEMILAAGDYPPAVMSDEGNAG